MRATLLAALSLCLAPLSVEAKPSRYGPVTEFVGDRYGSSRIAQGMSADEVARASKRKAGAKARHPTPHRKPRKRPPGVVAPLTMAGGFRREVGTAVATVIGGRPSGCPRRFCGCALSIKLFGRIVPRLNLAANWLAFPRATPSPGMVAARRGHVFKLIAHRGGNRWQVWDANSGRGRIRVHDRSIAGYVIVNPHGGRG